eukprot:CAMPEP_0168506624 /NCGR_PEP_ID=MMETSP0228-20121227/77469_1 /TAXON_ID=133427 /ORGANISM="Protoceratium reticulatum, Strain CCCM 535 (=CCMP 1889)" /LENGTH=1030 /DNA_ID=CAMNT_0008523721 /DNA_START=48 /DNA_END=3138 /DNA_ORIENTATION=-
MEDVEAVEVGVDVVVSKADPDALAVTVVSAIWSKGYCVVDTCLDGRLPREALADVSSIEGQGRFGQPPELVAEGLLGEEGSGRVAELEWFDSEARQDGRAVQHLDALLSQMQEELQPLLGEWLGFEAAWRTAGLLHESGMFPDGPPPEFDLGECQRWFATLAQHLLMLVLFVGPSEGRLALRPFGDDESDTAVVRMMPGTLVVLRADVLSHELTALGDRNYSLSCFLQDSPTGPMHVPRPDLESRASLTPCAKRLMEWADDHIRRLKALELREADVERHRVELPPGWRRAMNRTYFSGQHAVMSGLAVRSASTWQGEALPALLTGGSDLVTEVPLIRFDIDKFYDPDPEGWRAGKTFCKHGAFMDGIELFDNKFFAISPSEASSMDPQQRMILDAGFEAAHSAGLSKKSLMGAHGGVYVGMSYQLQWTEVDKTCTGAFNAMSGGSRVIPANRVSYALGMKGPSTTMDSGEASSLCAVALGREGVSRADAGRRHDEFSLCIGSHLELTAGRFWAGYQEEGMLSCFPLGRCFTFDAGANGFVPGDGTCALLLKLFAHEADGELVPCDSTDPPGLLASCGVLHSGLQLIDLADGPAQQEVVAEALRWARLSGDDIDIVECHGASHVLEDAVEVSSLAKALRVEEDPGNLLLLSCFKSSAANAQHCGGLAGLAKVLMCASLSTAAPSQHLNQANPLGAPLGLPAETPSELLAVPPPAVFAGVCSRGLGGTHAHVVLWAKQGAELAQAPATDLATAPAPNRTSVTFWPAGGGLLPEAARPVVGYWIVGSWSGWEPEPMESEGDGVYGCTVVLGESRWEAFQLCLDSDTKRALHPGQEAAPKGGPVCGPDAECEDFVWLLDGRGVHLGPGGELVEVWNEDEGLPGSQYRVRLRVAGRWRTVDWVKLAGEGGPSATGHMGPYFLAASWNDWSPGPSDELQTDPDTPGVFSLEVQLSHDGGEFLILRNKDWSQMFYPVASIADSETSVDVMGPDDGSDATECPCWYFGGRAGDTFRVEFQRRVDKDQDLRAVAWKQLK